MLSTSVATPLPDLYADDVARTYLGVLLSFNQFIPTSPVLPSDFHDLRDVEIFQAMLDLHAEGKEVFVDTLNERMELSVLPDVYWPKYIADIFDAGFGALSAKYYEKTIKDRAARRRRLQELSEEATQVVNVSIPFEGVVELARPYEVWNGAEALLPQPPIEWVVEPLIAQASTSLFFGEPGTKKTSSLLYMAACVVSGRPWLGFPTKKCGVLFIDEESGKMRLRRQLGMALRGALVDDPSLINCISLAGFRLDEPSWIHRLMTEIRTYQPGLVIFDNLAKMMTGDENLKKDVQPLMNALRSVSDSTGVPITGIHHSTKNTEKYRGSSSIGASVDLMVRVRSENGSNYVSFKTEKNRDGEPLQWSARAVWVGDKQFYLEPAATVKRVERLLSKPQEYVLTYLKKEGAKSRADIIANARENGTCEPDSARKAVIQLAAAGKINRKNAGGRGVPAIYELAEEEDA